MTVRGSAGVLSRVARAVAWIAAGGILVGSIFVMSFCFAMKMEMRATRIVVPDLSGLTREEAAAAAAPLDLAVEVVDQRHDPAVSSGRVLQQQPLPGSEVRRGRRLKVVLSLGGQVLRVPDLVGQAARTVEVELGRQGFVAGDEALVHDAAVPAGTVLAQAPAAGSPSVPRERVHRLVSLGPAERAWIMPDLTGRTPPEVERWTATCGFRLGPLQEAARAGRPPGTVVGQVPLAGYPVRAREVIRLTVAR